LVERFAIFALSLMPIQLQPHVGYMLSVFAAFGLFYAGHAWQTLVLGESIQESDSRLAAWDDD
jgi:hypothetical protein